MCKNKKEAADVPLLQVRTLTEVTVLAADASFAVRAVAVSLHYPAPEEDGQRRVLAALASHAADQADIVHRALEAAMEQREKTNTIV